MYMYRLLLIFTHLFQCRIIYIAIDITLQYAPFPGPSVSVVSLWTGKCLIKYYSFLYTIGNVRNLYGCPHLMIVQNSRPNYRPFSWS